MSSVRDVTTVIVIGSVDGSRPRKARQKARQRAAAGSTSYRIHADVLKAALAAAEGDPRRLDWSGAAVRDGVITMIRVLNHRPA